MLQPLVSLLRVIPGCPVHLGKRQWATPNRRPWALHRARRLPADLKPLCYNSEPRASIVCEFPRPRKRLPQCAVRTQTKTTWPQTGVRSSWKTVLPEGPHHHHTECFFFSSHLTCGVTLTRRDRKSLLCFSKLNLVCGRGGIVKCCQATLLCRRRILFFFSKWHAVQSPSNICNQDGKVEIPIVHRRWLTSLYPPYSLLCSLTQRAPRACSFSFFSPPQHKYWLRNMDLNRPTDCILGCAVRVLCKRPSRRSCCSVLRSQEK